MNPGAPAPCPRRRPSGIISDVTCDEPPGVASMLRHLTALFAVLAVAAGAGAADKKVTIRWHGQSFFEIISSAGTAVVTDPHAIDAFGRQSVKADVILCSHLHNDHTRIDVIEDRSKTKV